MGWNLLTTFPPGPPLHRLTAFGGSSQRNTMLGRRVKSQAACSDTTAAALAWQSAIRSPRLHEAVGPSVPSARLLEPSLD